MPNKIRNIQEDFIDETYGILFQKNVSIPIANSDLPVRCNVYRPLEAASAGTRLPVIMTYGPYGKDIAYSKFHPKSFSELNPAQKSPYSAWETPDPVYWCSNGYAIVRCDERGFGQSPGYLDSMSADTADSFSQAIEWAASQPWSSGKVGLLGVSYFAGTQWRAAARGPKGLTCIIPWEGMSDYYRDRCRHGGILSDEFIRFWWQRQVITNQYGRPGRAASEWGDDTLEGDLNEVERARNRCDQTVDNVSNRFRNDPYYASRDVQLERITIPLLSVANLGGIGLHLRGNVKGYMDASSEFKYLRFIVGRHDLPFYYEEEVDLQRGFLDAWLKGHDLHGWTQPGKVPPVSLIVRKGNVGYNDPEAEKAYERREEGEWPLTRTAYTRYYLTSDHHLTPDEKSTEAGSADVMSYKALGSIKKQQKVHFTSRPFETDIEITGHAIAHLNVSVSQDAAAASSGTTPCDMDLFLTLRHLDCSGNEVLYTGTVGDPVPLVKGWLRCSLRHTRADHVKHRHYLPYRAYFREDEELLKPGQIYEVDVEIWPTSVVLQAGEVLMLEIASGDTDGSGLFLHQDQTDRDRGRFAGWNHVHFGDGRRNYLQLPIIPMRA